MPYTIKKFNGETIATIQDGTVDTISTDLNLPGKNYAGYGKSLNESLVYLLENFANSVEPPNKVTGQLWFDTSVKKIKVYNGLSFKTLGSIDYGTTAPTSQLIGDMWFNTTTNQLFVYDGADHKLIGPNLVNPNSATLTSKRLIDSGGNIKTVLEASIEDTVVAIFSKDEFDINQNQTPVTGFSKIFKGITIASRVVMPNIKFGGVAKTAESLLVNNTEIPASNFVQNTGTSNQTMTTSLQIRVEPTIASTGVFTSLRGLFLGAADNFYLGYNGGVGYINNVAGNNISLGVTNSGTLIKVLTIANSAVTPGVDSTIDLGNETGLRFKTVYANNFKTIDNPNLAAGNSSFIGKLDDNGKGIVSTGGITGKLTGILVGDIQKVDQTPVLTLSGIEPVYAGRVNGNVYGNVINLQAIPDQQIAVNTNGTTTIFKGTLSGNAESATSIRISGTTYPGVISSVNNLNYRNTVPVRDADGNISAVQFLGVAQQAIAVLDQNNIPRVGSTASTPFTVVIRDSGGNINATNAGNAQSAETLAGFLPDSEPTSNTVAIRTGSADLKANFFIGTATSAQYADLAEKYLADADYEVGTVVMIGGEKEVTASKWGKRAIGAVSGNPAYLMNRDLEGGTAIALKGRVPVKVVGAIKKGEELIASNNGCAMMAVPHANGVFAIALETNNDTGVKLVECLIL